MAVFLRHSASDILRHLLFQLGHATIPGTGGLWPAFDSAEPETPDEIITTYTEKGRVYGRNQLTGETIEKLGVQFRVRSLTPYVGFAKASELAAVLDQEVQNLLVTVTDPSGELSLYVVENVNRSHPSVLNSGNVVPLGKSSSSIPGVTAPSSARNVHTINMLASIRNYF